MRNESLRADTDMIMQQITQQIGIAAYGGVEKKLVIPIFVLRPMSEADRRAAVTFRMVEDDGPELPRPAAPASSDQRVMEFGVTLFPKIALGRRIWFGTRNFSEAMKGSHQIGLPLLAAILGGITCCKNLEGAPCFHNVMKILEGERRGVKSLLPDLHDQS